MSESDDWRIYQGTGVPHDGINRLPPPPPWRPTGAGPTIDSPAGSDRADRRLGIRGAVYITTAQHVELVNAALYLRRPLLVTG